jgi:hypothetical protein
VGGGGTPLDPARAGAAQAAAMARDEGIRIFSESPEWNDSLCMVVSVGQGESARGDVVR